VKYTQKTRGWFIFGYGFDRTELGQFTFRLDVCLQHREFAFSLQLLGLILDLYITEPLPR